MQKRNRRMYRKNKAPRKSKKGKERGRDEEKNSPRVSHGSEIREVVRAQDGTGEQWKKRGERTKDSAL